MAQPPVRASPSARAQPHASAVSLRFTPLTGHIDEGLMAEVRVLSDQQRNEHMQQCFASLSGVGHTREETEGHWFPLMQTACILD